MTLLIVLALVAFVGWRLFFTSTARFWHLANQNADLALSLFGMERDCLVDAAPSEASRTEYVGPFRLTDKAGRAHKILIRRDYIDEIQARIAQQIKRA